MDRYRQAGDQRYAYVVDDDATFRKSLVLLLHTAGWHTRGFDSVPLFLEACPALLPGALLLDIRMPGIGGLDLIESKEPDIDKFAIIMVTGHGEVDTAVRSLKAGAVDFIEKPFSGDDLLTMLESSYAGLLQRVDLTLREKEAQQRVSKLSARELDVLTGLMAGSPHKVIARNLGISDRTVEMYRNNMIRKLSARTTTEALHMGIMAGLKPAGLRRAPPD